MIPGPSRSTRGSKAPERSVFRPFAVMLLAIVTVVCGAFSGAARPSLSQNGQVGTVELVSSVGAGAVQWLTSLPTQHTYDNAPAFVDRGTVEADLDDDVDGDDDRGTRSGVIDHHELTVRAARTARNPGRTSRGESPGDTSRFAVGSHTARGPPV